MAVLQNLENKIKMVMIISSLFWWAAWLSAWAASS
jgi:hypothetical protein